MRYSEYFASVKTRFMGTDVSNIKEHLAYQINVTGEGSGVFYVEIKDGKLHIEPYEYHDRDAMFTASAEVFDEIFDGKLDPAEACELKKLKVEGNLDKALLFAELMKIK